MPEAVDIDRTGVLVWALTASERRSLVEELERIDDLDVHGAAPTPSMVVKRVSLHEVHVVVVHGDVPSADVEEAKQRVPGHIRFARIPPCGTNLGALVRRRSRRMAPLDLSTPAARRAQDAPTVRMEPLAARAPKIAPTVQTEAVCISTSTGGPKALAVVLKGIPADFSLPILVMQHIPEGFAEQLAENLSGHSKIPVRVAIDGEEVKPGVIWLAPGDFHMGVVRDKTKIRLRLTKDAKLNNCRPAGDFLLADAVRVWGPAVLSVVLTGMGRDGEEGSRRVRDAGGMVIAQDEPTSVVWGMPGAVARADLAHQILPLAEVAHAIIRRGRKPSSRRDNQDSMPANGRIAS